MIRLDPNNLDGLLHGLGPLPEALASTPQEICKTAKVGIKRLMQDLDVAGRGEFEAQTRFLADACERLQHIQERLDALAEKNPEASDSTPADKSAQ